MINEVIEQQIAVTDRSKYAMLSYLATRGKLFNQVMVFDDLWDELLDQPYQVNWLRLLRINMRRLRSAVKILEPLLPPEGAQWLSFLKKTAAQLGHIREYDVAIKECEKYEAAMAKLEVLPEGAMSEVPLLKKFLKDKRSIQAELWLNMARKGWIEENLDDFLELMELDEKLTEEEEEAANAFVKARINSWGAKLCQKLKTIKSSDDMLQLHALRIRVKRFRYSYDVYMQRSLDIELLEQLKAMQDLLGFVRDGERSISVMEDMVANISADSKIHAELQAFKKWREAAIQDKLVHLDEVSLNLCVTLTRNITGLSTASL